MDHLKTSCRRNVTSCSHCHQRMERERLMTTHPAECLEWLVSCDNCEAEVKRSAMRAHLLVCPSAPEGRQQCDPPVSQLSHLHQGNGFCRPPVIVESNSKALSPTSPSTAGSSSAARTVPSPSSLPAGPARLKPKPQSPTKLSRMDVTGSASPGIGPLLQSEEGPDGVSCPYAAVGCPTAALEAQLAGHLEAEQPRHLGLLLQEVLRLRLENADLRRCQAETNGVILVMQRTIDALEDRLEALEHGEERLRPVKVAGSPSVALRHSQPLDFAATSPPERIAKSGDERDDDGRLECPSCGRRFCEDSFQRHVPVCQGKPKFPSSHRKSLPDALQGTLQATQGTSPSKPFRKRGSLTPLRSSVPHPLPSANSPPPDWRRCPKCGGACETKFCTKCGCPAS
eukprot:EG_transcript_9644